MNTVVHNELYTQATSRVLVDCVGEGSTPCVFSAYAAAEVPPTSRSATKLPRHGASEAQRHSFGGQYKYHDRVQLSLSKQAR